MKSAATRIRLLVSDVDGTLVTDDKRLTPATIAAAERLGAVGVALALVSSRPPHGVSLVADRLRLTTPRAGFNGGLIVAADGTVLRELVLPERAAREAVDELTAHGIDPWLFTADEWVIRNPEGPYVDREHRTVQLPPHVVEDFSPYLGRVAKIMAASENFSLLARMEDALRERLGGAAAAHRSQRYYLDITHPDAHKGEAARALADVMGVDLAETACIGDMANDVPMLDVAGLTIAMGNAPPEVQARAHEVTASNAEDGFAAAVERFILPRAAGGG